MNGSIKDKSLQIHLIRVISVPVFNFLMRLPCLPLRRTYPVYDCLSIYYGIFCLCGFR